MATLLRRIRRSRWPDTRPDWLPNDDAPATTLTDLNADGNTLSLWRVEDDGSNLTRLVTALASTGQFLSNVDIVLFTSDLVVGEVGHEPRQAPGDCADSHAAANWHVDLDRLSAQRLARLAARIYVDPQTKFERFSQSKVRELLRSAIKSGWFDIDQLSGELPAKIRG